VEWAAEAPPAAAAPPAAGAPRAEAEARPAAEEVEEEAGVVAGAVEEVEEEAEVVAAAQARWSGWSPPGSTSCPEQVWNSARRSS